jgi:hypothetical protein
VFRSYWKEMTVLVKNMQPRARGNVMFKALYYEPEGRG